VLDVVDDALDSAAKEGRKTSERVDEKFKVAIQVLDVYHTGYHKRPSGLPERMAEAREIDQSSSTIMNRLKEVFRVREKFAPSIRRYSDTTDSQPIEPKPKIQVKFLIHKSLPARDEHPSVPISVERKC
jgi:hypothetical protein